MLKKLLSEFAGTFFLVFAGTGAIVIDGLSGGMIGHAGISAVFGLAVATMIYAFGHISGCHINPAVTLAQWSTGKFELKQVPAYILAQLGGALTASVLLGRLFPSDKTLLGTTLPFNDSWKTAFGTEFVLTFVLMFTILAVIASGRRLAPFAGLIIGAVVFLDALFGGPVCGASMNPARSLAPALVSASTKHLWVYMAAPVAGALAAAGSFHIFFKVKRGK